MCGVIVVEDRAEPCGDGRGVPATVRVANRPIADHVLEALGAAGVRRVVVVSSERTAASVRGCLDAAPSAAGLMVTFARRPGPVALASALATAAPVIDGSACLVHAAGGLLAEPLAPLAAAVQRDSDAVLMVHRERERRVGLRVPVELPLGVDGIDRAALAVTGVWALGAGALAQATAHTGAEDLDLTRLTGRIAAAGGRVDVRFTGGWRAYCGESADLLELNRVALDRLQAAPAIETDGNRIEGRVFIHERAEVERSVIVGPTVIGPGACVTDSYVGPYTSIGEGVRIQGAEIERSIVEAGASISHVGSRLSASVIGRDARVFRDFELPRSLRLNVGSGAEIGLC